MPNTDEGAPANSSDDEAGQTDQDGSSDDGSSGDSKGDQQTLEQRAQRNLQGLMDQNKEYLQQGRYQDMNPKVVELLGLYDQLTRGNPGSSQAEPNRNDYGLGFGERSGSEDPRMTELAKEGLKSKQRELIGQIAGQVEQDILKETWAEDIKALFAEYGKDGITEEEYASIDPLNRQAFPYSRQGYRAWLTAANTFRVKRTVAKAAAEAEGEGDGEGSSASAVDRDRANAQNTKRKPQISSTGQGTQDLETAAKRRREGRGPSDAEFREQIKKTIKQSGMGGSSHAR